MSLEKSFILGQFRTKVLIHILLIGGILTLGTFFFVSNQSLLTFFLLAAILIYVVFSLFKLVNKTNRDLTNFLMSIRFDDFEASFTQRNLGSDDKVSLNRAFNLITGKFRDIRSEKEAQYQFLLTLVEQVDTGLICFDQNGRTVLMNHALRRILHKSYIPSLKAMNPVSQQLYEALNAFVPGDKVVIKVLVQNSILQLSINGTVIVKNGEALHLFSIQNIGAELDQHEMKSWQKLIRILTHEIMNSVSPVVSLAATTDQIISQSEGLENSVKSDIHQAIGAIKKRGESLLSFTERYRELTRIPPPDMTTFNLLPLLDRLCILFQTQIEEKGILLVKKFPKRKVMIMGDESLLEQAFINLLKNGFEALEGHKDPTLEILVYKEGPDTVLQIGDNGDGISPQMMDKIFVPFFTTKEKGSGIGLSLCRQIILMHEGSIHATSERGKGSVFTVRI